MRVDIEHEIELIVDPYYGVDPKEEGCVEGVIYLLVNVEGDVSRYVPAKTYGDPGNCYPEEGGEAEIIGLSPIRVTMNGLEGNTDGKSVDISRLTDADIDFLLSDLDRKYILDALSEAAYKVGDDSDDRYDEWKEEQYLRRTEGW